MTTFSVARVDSLEADDLERLIAEQARACHAFRFSAQRLEGHAASLLLQSWATGEARRMEQNVHYLLRHGWRPEIKAGVCEKLKRWWRARVADKAGPPGWTALVSEAMHRLKKRYAQVLAQPRHRPYRLMIEHQLMRAATDWERIHSRISAMSLRPSVLVLPRGRLQKAA